MSRKIQKTEELDDLGLKQDNQSDLEFEEMLFEDQPENSRPTGRAAIISGFGLLSTAAIFILQEIGLIPGNIFSDGFIMIPLIGIMLVLLFGLFPKKRKSKRRVRRKDRKSTRTKDSPHKKKSLFPTMPENSKWNFPPKSRKKYLAGVCGGLAERINMDPKLFRFLFLVALVTTGGTVPLVAYVLFAIFMPPPKDEEEIDIL
ncbi:MAG: PspC domain-containing protein [Bacteroidetes bacterium]|nr:PspC domain-containing protein [Bacteroidota bacterium]MCY4234557.1 PspC domain-containing protein [Bacteroidota bacterium]